MYHITDKVAAIRAVQRMLGVNPTGRLDTQTVNKIEYITGSSEYETVDYSLFLNIKSRAKENRYREYIEKRLNISEERLITGKYLRSEMQVINTMLAEAISKNGLNSYSPRGYLFSRDSAAAVRELRCVFNLSESDLVDAEFLYLLIKNLDAHRLANNNSTL